MTFLEFLLASGAVMTGAMLQGSVGFGLGMWAAPFLVLIYPPLVPGPLLASAVSLTVLLAWREWHGIEFGHLKWSLSGRLLGVALAALILTVVPADRIALAFGTLILVAVGLSASGLHLTINPRTLLGAGVASGFMSTTASIGGPPMALLYQHEPGSRLRGTLSAYFVVGVAFSLAGLRLVGMFGLTELLLALQLVPSVVLGYVLSHHGAGLLGSRYLRAAVLIVSGGAAVVVIVVNVV